MRVLVCGGRNYADVHTLYDVLDSVHASTPIACVIEGGARGADYLASIWSAKNNIETHCRFSADWAINGKAAGAIRNQRMLTEGKPDLVISFPGGRGTADMVGRAKAAGVRVIEVGPRT